NRSVNGATLPNIQLKRHDRGRGLLEQAIQDLGLGGVWGEIFGNGAERQRDRKLVFAGVAPKDLKEVLGLGKYQRVSLVLGLEASQRLGCGDGVLERTELIDQTAVLGHAARPD